jgi:Anti-sigma-K factor rskA/Putative zinc-finger
VGRPTAAAQPPHLDAAGWLLGALDSAESAQFEAHLETCKQCQEDVAALGPTVTRLTGVAPDAESPDRLGLRTVQAVQGAARSRRRRRWAATSLAAAAVIAAVITSAALLIGGSSPKNVHFALTGTNGSAAAGTATAHDTGHGWSVQLSVHGLPTLQDRAFYECWYVDPSQDRPGHPFRISAGTFDGSASGNADLQMWSWADPHQFQVMQVTVQPVDGNPATSGKVVLSGVVKLG